MKRIAPLLVAALLGAAAPAVADAQRRPEGPPDRAEQRGPDRAEREIPLDTLVKMVERRTGGSYVNANPRFVGGRKFYWMRLKFPGGEFRDFMVDAATGTIQ